MTEALQVIEESTFSYQEQQVKNTDEKYYFLAIVPNTGKVLVLQPMGEKRSLSRH